MNILTSLVLISLVTLGVYGCTSDEQLCNGQCYNPASYTCTKSSQFGEVLCSSSTPACGSRCYDPSLYQCCNDQVIQKSSSCGSGSSSGSDNYAGQQLASIDLQFQLSAAPTEQYRVDVLSSISDSQWVFDWNTATTGVKQGPGAKLIDATPSNWPAIIGHGLSATWVTLAPCGLNLPHFHPRGTTINTVFQGEYQTGFILENGDRFHPNNVSAGQSILIPQGALHFEQNLLCTETKFVAVFSSQDASVFTVGNALFGLPSGITEAALNLTAQAFESIQQYLPSSPIIGLQECRARCGL